MKLRHRFDRDISMFDGVAPFDGIAPSVLRSLTANTDRAHVPAGTTIGREGRPARQFVVVLSGEVIALRHGEPVDRFGPGTQVGGVSLVQGIPSDVTLVAATPLELLVVNGPAFRWAAQLVPTDAWRTAT